MKDRGFETRIAPANPGPTVSDVTTGLLSLVSKTQPGDLSVVYLAGHGYRTRDDSGDEADGWDETFVCSDGALRDDWFRDELWTRARARARFVVVADACHSDSMTVRLRAEPVSPSPFEQRGRDYYRLVLAACRDEETTGELVSGDSGGGVVTTSMLSALRHDPELTYADLWSQVANAVQRDFPHQFPQHPHLSSFGPDDSLLRSRAFVGH